MIIRKVIPTELEKLQDLCIRIYPIYFGDYWENDGLAKFLEDQFGTPRLSDDLTSPGIDYFFICDQGKEVGFLKVIYQTANKHFEGKGVSEIEKIYIGPEHISKGLGNKVMLEMVDLLQEIGKSTLILDVLDTNLKGIAFYERFGFIHHSSVKLKYPNFKEELSGLNLMYYPL